MTSKRSRKGRWFDLALALVAVVSFAAALGAAFEIASPGESSGLPADALDPAQRPPGLVMPSPALTPGDVFDAGIGEICRSGYASSVRDVSNATKERVYASYGITSRQPGQYEVDHLVPLAIGGSNDVKNLWPQPAEPRPGYKEKDRLEDALHDLVCSGKLDLRQAQAEAANDWYAAYVRYVLKKGR